MAEMSSKEEYLNQLTKGIWNDLVTAFLSITGWGGGFLVNFFGRGTIATTVAVLWCLDLFSGAALARKISRWDNEIYGEMPEELQQEIKEKKKAPFSWKRFTYSLEKLTMWMVLILTTQQTRSWLTVGSPLFYYTFSAVLGIVDFMIVYTEFRSVVKNVAYNTGNPHLLKAAKKLSLIGDNAVNKIPGGDDKNG